MHRWHNTESGEDREEVIGEVEDIVWGRLMPGMIKTWVMDPEHSKVASLCQTWKSVFDLQDADLAEVASQL